MIQIGIIGFGFMGRTHFNIWNDLPDCQVVAICDANPDISKTINRQIGNIDTKTSSTNIHNISIYTDLHEMLNDCRLDAVSLTLPTYLHAEISCALLSAGVNVLCEKPMALNLNQCQTMIDASQHSDRKLMIGHCIRFWPEYHWLKNIIDSGQFGQLRSARFDRVSAKPNWSSDNWLTDSIRSGGMMLDLHIHDTDFIQYLLGTPQTVTTQTLNQCESTPFVQTQYGYDNLDAHITASGSWLATDSYAFKMGFEVHTDQATIIYDSRQSPPLTCYPNGQDPFTPQLPEKDGYHLEIKWFNDLIHHQTNEMMITPQQSMESIRIIEAEKQSAQTGQPVNL